MRMCFLASAAATSYAQGRSHVTVPEALLVEEQKKKFREPLRVPH